MKFLSKHFSKSLLFSLIILFFTNCQKDNEHLSVDEKSVEPEQSKSRQSHLRAEDMASIVDFVNAETNNTRQVVIDKSGIKKAKQDYRTSGMSSRTDSQTSFGYIDTSNALVVESDNVISYTFKVVTKDLTNFVNYIVVEDKATLDKYGYFMKYTPTTEWIENKLPLSSFSGTIDYFNDNEELQTTLTLSEGTIVDIGETIIPCPEIIFNPNDDSSSEEGTDDPEDSTADNGSTDDSTGSGSGSSSNGGVDDGTVYYNPWEFFWTGWIGGGQDNGGDDNDIDAGDDGDNTGSSGGTCGSNCDAEPGKACSSEDHPYNNRLGQINLKSEPTADNPCVHTGVIAFLMLELEFTDEQLTFVAHIDNAEVYEQMINYLNANNYSPIAIDFVQLAIETLMEGVVETFNEFVLNDELEDNPYKLIEIDCDQIQHWQELAQHKPPQSVLDKIELIDQINTTLFGDFDVQYIQDAQGAVINMDFFPVAIDILPNNPDTGQQFTADEFLEYIRTNINDFVNTDYSQFIPSEETGINESDIWFSNDPLGAIVHINIPGGHDGSVVCSDYDMNSLSDTGYWIFTTLEMPWGITQGLDGPHPVSGNRQFGYTLNNDGSYTFFTRAVDRFESQMDYEAASYISDGQPFLGADNLWLSFQQGIQNFTNNNGGVGNVSTPSINRPNWEEVKDVLLGNRPISDLGCD